MVGNEEKGKIYIYNQIIGNETDDIVEVIDIASESSATLDHHTTDMQLVADLIAFINDGDSTNLSFIEGALHSHLACFAAEIAREEERVVYLDELIK